MARAVVEMDAERAVLRAEIEEMKKKIDTMGKSVNFEKRPQPQNIIHD